MTEFLFVRHCEAETNCQPDLIGGRSNHSLATARGEKQALLLGEYLRECNYTPTAVYSSGAVRADTTASISLRAAGLPHDIITDERLQELAQGEFEGRPRILAYTPEMIAMHELNELHGALPGGESILDVQARMMEFIANMHHEHPSGKLLVFSHGIAIRSAVGVVERHTKQQIVAGTTPNVSLTKISIANNQLQVHYVGKVVIKE